jgi:hypothetical protein
MSLHIAADIKHPDSMTRKEKLQRIASFQCDNEAFRFWLTHCPRISKKAFYEARGC